MLRTNGREEGQRQKAYLCREGGGETEAQSLILWLLVLELLAGGWWLPEAQSYLGLAKNTFFVYLALRTSALGMGQTG